MCHCTHVWLYTCVTIHIIAAYMCDNTQVSYICVWLYTCVTTHMCDYIHVTTYMCRSIHAWQHLSVVHTCATRGMRRCIQVWLYTCVTAHMCRSIYAWQHTCVATCICDNIHHTTLTHGGDQNSNIQISRSNDFLARSFEWQGLCYSREILYENMGTPAKTCLICTGTPVKTCRKFWQW